MRLRALTVGDLFLWRGEAWRHWDFGSVRRDVRIEKLSMPEIVEYAAPDTEVQPLELCPAGMMAVLKDLLIDVAAELQETKPLEIYKAQMLLKQAEAMLAERQKGE